MVCEHLRQLEQELAAAGIRETCRGQVWSDNCREWVYYDCLLDRASLRERLRLDACVKDHDHLGTHDGQESGFACETCKDGIMGLHEAGGHEGKPTFR